MKFFGRRKKEAQVTSEIFTGDINKISGLPHHVTGGFKLYGHWFYFHDAASFYQTYMEIFKDEIYKFKPINNFPVIIDCGANMGVSLLYFSKEFPQAKIIAFEPDETIYQTLFKHIGSFGLKVSLHKKAVWDSETVLPFTTDNGMGGSIVNKFANQVPKYVDTVRLANYLKEPVDLLKLDIEGAEFTVLKDCGPFLQNVQNLFVEYHSFINQEQRLAEILIILKEAGFRYHLKQSFSQQRPFIDRILACENMDMAITIFAYRE